VLEIDDPYGTVLYEEVPTVEITVVDHPRLRVQAARDLRKVPAQHGGVVRRHGPAEAAFDAPLDEMLELPGEQPLVERLLEGQAGVVVAARPIDLDEQQLVDGLLIETLDAVFRLLLHGVPQRRIPDVFEQQDAAVSRIDVHLGYGHAQADQEAVDV